MTRSFGQKKKSKCEFRVKSFATCPSKSDWLKYFTQIQNIQIDHPKVFSQAEILSPFSLWTQKLTDPAFDKGGLCSEFAKAWSIDHSQCQCSAAVSWRSKSEGDIATHLFVAGSWFLWIYVWKFSHVLFVHPGRGLWEVLSSDSILNDSTWEEALKLAAFVVSGGQAWLYATSVLSTGVANWNYIHLSIVKDFGMKFLHIIFKWWEGELFDHEFIMVISYCQLYIKSYTDT